MSLLLGSTTTLAVEPSLHAKPTGSDPVVINLAADQSKGGVTAYVTAGTVALEGRLHADQLMASGATLIGSGTIAITAEGGKPGDPVTVAPGATIAVAITVDEVGPVGTWQSSVTITAGTVVTPLGSVSVTKAPAAAYSVRGATDTGLVINADRTSFTTVLQVDSHLPAGSRVELSVAPLTVPAGASGCVTLTLASAADQSCDAAATTTPAPASVAPGATPGTPACACGSLALPTQELAPLGSVQVALAMILGGEGEYGTALLIQSGGSRIEVPLTIKRTLAPAPFAAASPPTLHLQRFDPTQLNGGTIVVTLDPSSIRYFDVPTLNVLSALTREEGAGRDATLIKTTITAPRSRPANLADPIAYQLDVKDPSAQGTYTGTLKAAAADQAAVTIPVKVVVRDGPLAAFAAIIVGMILGWAVRHYLTTGRPRLARKGRIRRQVASATGFVSRYPDEAEVQRPIAFILQRLVRLEAANDDEHITPAAIEDALTAIDLQLDHIDRWASILADVRLIRRATDADTVAIRAEIDTFEAALSSEEKADDVQAALATFNALGHKVDATAEGLLRVRIASALSLAQDLDGWAPGDALGDAQHHLTTAEALIGERGTRPQAATEINEAETAVLQHLVPALQRAIAAPPANLTDQGYRDRLQEAADDLRRSTEADATPEAALKEVARVRTTFYEATRDALAALQPPPAGTVKAAYDRLVTALEPDHRSLAAAALAYKDLVAAARPPRRRGAHDEGVAAGGLGMEPIRVEPSRWVDTSVEKIERWWTPTRVIRAADALVFVVLLLVASVITLGALWTPNEVWGTLPDYLTAILVGFGVKYSATDATSTTIDSVWRDAMKPAPA